MTKEKTEYIIKIPKVNFYGLIITLLGIMFTFYITTNNDIEKIKLRLDYQDNQQQNITKNNEKINEKLDFIITKVAGIEATMKYKEDKKTPTNNYSNSSSNSILSYN